MSYVLMSSELTYLELTSGEVLEAGTGLKTSCSRCQWSYGPGHICSKLGPAYSSELQLAYKFLQLFHQSCSLLATLTSLHE